MNETDQEPKCLECNGSGTVSRSYVHPTNPMLDGWDSYPCGKCGGSGKYDSHGEFFPKNIVEILREIHYHFVVNCADCDNTWVDGEPCTCTCEHGTWAGSFAVESSP